MKESAALVSRGLYELKTRGMVSSCKDKNGKLEWRVTRPTSGVFELLPRLKVQVRAPQESVEKVAERTSVRMEFRALPQRTLEEEAYYTVKGMPVELAHAVYLKLKTYFNPEVS